MTLSVGSNLKVLRINAKDTHRIRELALQANMRKNGCIFSKDEDERTFHLGAFEDTKLVSIASFYFQKHPKIDEQNQYRLRGMATLPDYQRKGLSSELLKTAFPIIKQNLCTALWCNVRERSMGFYEKVGFKLVEGPFDLPPFGKHYLMVKTIK